MDYLITRKEVDPDRIALYGHSFGGYLAPRAAAFEHRIHACIANGGIYDYLEPQFAKMQMNREQGMNSILNNPEEVDKIVYDLMKTEAQIRWAMQDGMWKFGADTPHELFLKESEYNLKDCVKQIQCPMLIIDSEKDQFFAGQAKKLYDVIQSPKKFILFTVEESAEEHCQMGASSISHQKIYDWLDKIFGI